MHQNNNAIILLELSLVFAQNRTAVSYDPTIFAFERLKETIRSREQNASKDSNESDAVS